MGDGSGPTVDSPDSRTRLRAMRTLHLLALLGLLLAFPLPASAQGDDGEEPTDVDAPSSDEDPFPAPPDVVGEPAEAPDPPPPAVDLARPSSVLYAEGYQQFADGQFVVATICFEEVLRRKPDHPSARNYLVECFVAVGRNEDAAAVREGALPPGEPTPVAGPPEPPQVEVELEEPKKELFEEERENRKNPRRLGFASLGIQLGGPALGLGVHLEFKPSWFFAASGGVGAVGVISSSGRGSIGAAWLEVSLRPVPLRVTPTIGVGVVLLGGSDVWRLDAYSRSLLGQGQYRASAYVLLGLRYDSRKGLFLSGGVGLVPTGQTPLLLLPYPSFRAGLRF